LRILYDLRGWKMGTTGVMPGLDPGIHHLQETALFSMDCRVKPGNDTVGQSTGF
jgi:hypothetical protein